MNTNNTPLSKTLSIIWALNYYGNLSSELLMAREEISIATLKRYIADARLLGADIVSVKVNETNYYRILNYAKLKEKLDIWQNLCEGKTLLGSMQST